MRIGSAEFAEWMAYDQLEPLPDRRDDYRAALIAMTMANLWRGASARPYALDEFVLRFGEPEPPPMTTERVVALFAGLGIAPDHEVQH